MYNGAVFRLRLRRIAGHSVVRSRLEAPPTPMIPLPALRPTAPAPMRRCRRSCTAWIALALVACSAGSEVTPAPTDPPPGSGTAPVTDAAPVSTATPISLWWVDALEPGEPGSAGLVNAILEGLPSAPPVEVVVKPAYGSAGIEAVLRSTVNAAPERLPDLMVLPLGSLRAARAEGLIKPLPLTGDRAEAAFAFAADRAHDGEQTWALPLAVDLLQTIGRNVTPPETWDALERSGIQPLILPLGGSTVPDLAPLLAVYAGFGGSLADLPAVDPDALQSAFEALADGLAAGWLRRPDNGSSPRAAWNSFAASDPPLAIVDAGSVVDSQAGYPGMTWAPLPGSAGPVPALAWGWALVVTGPAPERQAEATLIASQLADAFQAGPVVAAGWLPARRADWQRVLSSTLDPAPEADYLDDLEAQLDAAILVDGDSSWRAGWAQAGADLAGGAGAATAASRLLGP